MEQIISTSTKRNKIVYWIATGWLALGMGSTGMVQLLKMKEEVARMTDLGFPIYLLTIIGIGKLLGVIAVLIPKFPLLKEWAYAGFFFTMAGAIYAHISVGHPMKELFGPALLLVLTILSWYFRPTDRKLASINL